MGPGMPIGDTTSPELERFGTIIVDSFFKIRDRLGPGLLESAYEICLYHELTSRGLLVRRQVEVPIVYDGIKLDAGFRIDLLVEECIVIEVKSVQELYPVFKAQVLTHLNLMNRRLGFLVNFNVILIKDGIPRIIH
jgi:GxxExxY protein